MNFGELGVDSRGQHVPAAEERTGSEDNRPLRLIRIKEKRKLKLLVKLALAQRHAFEPSSSGRQQFLSCDHPRPAAGTYVCR